ncbi:hypothetical protein BJ508DRAFT_30441 [Ascobolus immersus RN42]|uniref:Uncharacterized protein n=1 Tax=Ascobolus immersus RN42 TaxID=1160509 RepID=A0A3N4HSD6_ASCIM|nr:hypothetical protein BJ508DRAFT_30441 [Ascobolus immersus RN42]
MPYIFWCLVQLSYQWRCSPSTNHAFSVLSGAIISRRWNSSAHTMVLLAMQPPLYNDRPPSVLSYRSHLTCPLSKLRTRTGHVVFCIPAHHKDLPVGLARIPPLPHPHTIYFSSSTASKRSTSSSSPTESLSSPSAPHTPPTTGWLDRPHIYTEDRPHFITLQSLVSAHNELCCYSIKSTFIAPPPASPSSPSHLALRDVYTTSTSPLSLDHIGAM